MRRITLLAMLVGIMTVLATGVAVAKVIDGTRGNDKLVGTSRADTLNGFAGNDKLYGKGGNDTLKGYIGNDAPMRGAAGEDTILGGFGRDSGYGDAGDDLIKMVGDTDQDFVNCGEDADGTDVDRAEVSGNDLVDGTAAGALTTTLGLSCEVVVVDGVPVPQL